MPSFLHVDHKLIAATALAATSGVALYSTYRLWCLSRSIQRDNVYESRRSLYEYLVFHYGAPREVLAWDFGPVTALEFPKRCAELCMKYSSAKDGNQPRRAFDIGCSVGRSSFELTREFDEVVGLDFSQSFIDACNQLNVAGEMPYEVPTVGDLTEKLVAEVDPSLNRRNARFIQGDACALPRDLGRFDCVLAANLICRLHTPSSFFDRLPDLVCPGGILVITSPYTFHRDFTPRKKWIGGWVEDGREISGFDGLKRLLLGAFDFVAEENVQFLIRETERKHQWTVAHATVWQRKN